VAIVLRADPPDAELRLDGGAPSTAPVATTLAPGRHSYRAAKPGYETIAGVFEVGPDGLVGDPGIKLVAVGPDAGTRDDASVAPPASGASPPKTAGRGVPTPAVPVSPPAATTPTPPPTQPSRPPRVIDDTPSVKVIQ
jgi:hypothetical protein